MGLIVLTGGARSGKSSFAVAMAKRWDGEVSVIATAEGRDDEMRHKIAVHQRERPQNWTVIEEPIELSKALNDLGPDGFVIVDCLTLWVANLMERGIPDAEIIETATKTAALAAGRQPPVVCVTNEVGSGSVPLSELGRRYRDVLGSVNKAWVAASERAYVMVSGRAVALMEPEEIL